MRMPVKLQTEFIAFMAAHDNDGLPDGAWLAVLEDAGWQFLREKGIRGDGSDAALEYVRLKYKSIPPSNPSLKASEL